MFDYRVGIEEEFFVIDARTRNVRERMPTKFFQACKRHLQDQVTNELLQSQIGSSPPPAAPWERGAKSCGAFDGCSQSRQHGMGSESSLLLRIRLQCGVSRNRRAKTATAKSWKRCRWWASVTCSAACTSMWRCPIRRDAWRSCIARCPTCTCSWR